MIFSNKKYRNESPEAKRISYCLHEILTELHTLRDAQHKGYSLMSIEEVKDYLIELTKILEGGDVND